MQDCQCNKTFQTDLAFKRKDTSGIRRFFHLISQEVTKLIMHHIKRSLLEFSQIKNTTANCCIDPTQNTWKAFTVRSHMICSTSVDSSRNGSEKLEKVIFPPDGSQSQTICCSGSVTVVARSNNKTTKLGKLRTRGKAKESNSSCTLLCHHVSHPLLPFTWI